MVADAMDEGLTEQIAVGSGSLEAHMILIKCVN
jgi:hypothetical protein